MQVSKCEAHGRSRSGGGSDLVNRAAVVFHVSKWVVLDSESYGGTLWSPWDLAAWAAVSSEHSGGVTVHAWRCWGHRRACAQSGISSKHVSRLCARTGLQELSVRVHTAVGTRPTQGHTVSQGQGTYSGTSWTCSKWVATQAARICKGKTVGPSKVRLRGSMVSAMAVISSLAKATGILCRAGRWDPQQWTCRVVGGKSSGCPWQSQGLLMSSEVKAAWVLCTEATEKQGCTSHTLTLIVPALLLRPQQSPDISLCPFPQWCGRG